MAFGEASQDIVFDVRGVELLLRDAVAIEDNNAAVLESE
jgi:hypothetical protein